MTFTLHVEGFNRRRFRLRLSDDATLDHMWQELRKRLRNVAITSGVVLTTATGAVVTSGPLQQQHVGHSDTLQTHAILLRLKGITGNCLVYASPNDSLETIRDSLTEHKNFDMFIHCSRFITDDGSQTIYPGTSLASQGITCDTTFHTAFR